MTWEKAMVVESGRMGRWSEAAFVGSSIFPGHLAEEDACDTVAR